MTNYTVSETPALKVWKLLNPRQRLTNWKHFDDIYFGTKPCKGTVCEVYKSFIKCLHLGYRRHYTKLLYWNWSIIPDTEQQVLFICYSISSSTTRKMYKLTKQSIKIIRFVNHHLVLDRKIRDMRMKRMIFSLVNLLKRNAKNCFPRQLC